MYIPYNPQCVQREVRGCSARRTTKLSRIEVVEAHIETHIAISRTSSQHQVEPSKPVTSWLVLAASRAGQTMQTQIEHHGGRWDSSSYPHCPLHRKRPWDYLSFKIGFFYMKRLYSHGISHHYVAWQSVPYQYDGVGAHSASQMAYCNLCYSVFIVFIRIY